MNIYSDLIRPLLFQLDPEDAHALAKSCKRFWPHYRFKPKATETPIAFSHNWVLSHPIGLAAGFDKNGEMIEQLFNLGFSFVEVGSVTAFPYGGNDKPRLARLKEHSGLVNRMGLNSQGAVAVAKRLHRVLTKQSLPIGVNLARTNDPLRHEAVGPVEDLMLSFECFKTLPLAYIAFNISCPNSHEGVLKESELVLRILNEVKDRNYRNVPIMLKLSPDSPHDFITGLLTKIEQQKFEVYGYICGNTASTTMNQELVPFGAPIAGGISGPLIREKALSLTKTVRSLCTSDQVVIGCGGVSDGQSAHEFLRAGADLVQLYTALVYRGPGAAVQIADELSNSKAAMRVLGHANKKA